MWHCWCQGSWNDWTGGCACETLTQQAAYGKEREYVADRGLFTKSACCVKVARVVRKYSEFAVLFLAKELI